LRFEQGLVALPSPAVSLPTPFSTRAPLVSRFFLQRAAEPAKTKNPAFFHGFFFHRSFPLLFAPFFLPPPLSPRTGSATSTHAARVCVVLCLPIPAPLRPLPPLAAVAVFPIRAKVSGLILRTSPWTPFARMILPFGPPLTRPPP